MKFTATLLVLVSFIGLAVFGIAFMDSGKHHESSFIACVGSLTQGATCPSDNPVASSIFHLNSFRAFSSSPLTQSVALLLVTVGLLLAAAMLKAIRVGFVSSLNTKPLALKKIFETSYQPFKEEKILWNSLHENSPAIT